MGIADRKAREFKRREEEILDAAYSLFIEKGLDGVTIEMIAEASEVGKGTIYKHFSSKHDIYAYLVIGHFEKTFKLIDKNIDPDASTEDQIRQYIRNHLTFFTEDEGAYKIVSEFEAILSEELLSPEVYEKLNRMHQMKHDQLERLLVQAAEDGKIIDESPGDLAILAISMFFGAIDALAGKTVSNPERLYGVIEDALIKAFAKEE